MDITRFIVTGTRAYGPARPDSDLDIVILKKDSLKLLAWLQQNPFVKHYQEAGQEMYGDQASLYFVMFGITVNIIVAADEEEFARWERGTNYMRTIPPIPDRDLRVQTFENACLNAENDQNRSTQSFMEWSNSYFTPCQAPYDDCQDPCEGFDH